jgi:hypothetical protein
MELKKKRKEDEASKINSIYEKHFDFLKNPAHGVINKNIKLRNNQYTHEFKNNNDSYRDNNSVYD